MARAQVNNIGTENEHRRHWLSVLARTDAAVLEEAWQGIEAKPGYAPLRPVETGLVMVRGRTGGTGAPFNLGEMTVSRCSVRIDGGVVGHGYVAGRNRRHAELVALFDALLQDPDRRPGLQASLLEPQSRRQAERKTERAAQAAATRVEFFTMVRGED